MVKYRQVYISGIGFSTLICNFDKFNEISLKKKNVMYNNKK
jgi:hypothetical protein